MPNHKFRIQLRKHQSDVKEGNRNIKRCSELVEDDECRRLPQRPRLLDQDLAFPVYFNTDNLGARKTSNTYRGYWLSLYALVTLFRRSTVIDSRYTSVGCSPIPHTRTRTRARMPDSN